MMMDLTLASAGGPGFFSLMDTSVAKPVRGIGTKSDGKLTGALESRAASLSMLVLAAS